MLSEEIADTSAEETKTFGAKIITDFTQKSLCDAFTCSECGRCTTVCPANISGKTLSPRKIIMSLRDAAEQAAQTKRVTDSVHSKITRSEIWACTTCNACTEACPLAIDHLKIILDLRRYQVLELSAAPQTLNAMFANIENNGAPWQFSFDDRLLWANNRSIRTFADEPKKNRKPEYLLWVGCAGAFDHRYKKVIQSFTQILNILNADYAVLGTEETCCGDPAKRAGNEMLYQLQALQNIETFKRYEVRKIITTCPHCFNVFKNEYPELGVNLEVEHYTQFLSKTIENKKLSLKLESKRIAFHDPCYLGRGNKIYAQPRTVIQQLTRNYIEVCRSREKSFCCGAGGGQMFCETNDNSQAINEIRFMDFLKQDTQIIATACPFCLTMLADAIKNKQADSLIETLDIAELLLKAIETK